MLLYRALNESDMKNVDKQDNIYCSLCNKVDDVKKKYKLYHSMCLKNMKKNLFNSIIYHVYNCDNKSYWLSTSSSFDEVMEKYSLPTSNDYNYLGNRKHILIMNMDDKLIYDNIEDIKDIKSLDFAVDLRGGLIENEMNDILVYGAIKKDNQELVIYPLLQDIIYSTNMDIDNDLIFLNQKFGGIKFLLNRMYYKLDSLFSEFYPNINSSVNLTDYLKDHYKEIPGQTIEEKYDYLKRKKKYYLNRIVEDINGLYYTDYTVNRLIDDKIYVSSLFKLLDISEDKMKNLLYIEHNNIMYPYSYMSSNSINDSNNKELIRKK